MNEKLIIPLSIIVAGCIIAVAIYMSGGQRAAQTAGVDNHAAPSVVSARKVEVENDHIQGNQNAEVFVIEYSDLECPFCKRYHDGPLSQLKEAYAGDDRVAFVFRHFPLDEPYTNPLHPTATEIHIAAECVAKLGGDESFFNFVSDVFASSDSTDLSLVGSRAARAGVNQTQFESCYNNRETEPIIAASFQEGSQAGVQGTPTVMIQTKQGNTYQAVPDFGSLKIAVDAYLAELK